jgi:hypothetical protein
MKIKNESIIIGVYGLLIFSKMFFLIATLRFDMLIISGPISLIPLIFILFRRYRTKNDSDFIDNH